MLRRRWPIALFAAWSAYVWTTRIVNAWSASDETATAKAISTVTAVALLAGAVAAVVILVAARARALRSVETLVLRIFAGATLAVWAVRVPLIILDSDHNVAFKVVHTVLAAISVVLAVLTWTRSAPSAPDDAPPVAGTGATAAVSPGAKVGR